MQSIPLSPLNPTKPISDFACVGIIQNPSAPVQLCVLVKSGVIMVDSHYAPAAGTPVLFTVGGGNQVQCLTTDKITKVPNMDVSFIRLDSGVPVPVPTFARLDEIITSTDFIGTGIKDILTNPTPVTAKMTLLRVLSSSGQVVFRQNVSATAEPGDSGSPVFVSMNYGPKGGQIYKLVGTIYGITPVQTLVHAVAPFLSQISAL